MEMDKTLFDIIMEFAREAAGKDPVDAVYALCGYARLLDPDQEGIGRHSGATEDELRQASVLKMLLSSEDLDSLLFAKYMPLYPSAFAHTADMAAAYKNALSLVQAQGGDDPDRLFSALFRHLLISERDALRVFAIGNSEEDVRRMLSRRSLKYSGNTAGAPEPRLMNLMQQSRTLERQLRRKVIGQEYAIRAFAKGYFHAACMNLAPAVRRGPAALFLFAGPAGTGKSLLAREAARALSRPCKVLNMRVYSTPQSAAELTGTPAASAGASPGLLTDYVYNYPDCILVIDELERADPSITRLFLQILDEGELEDTYRDEMVSFKDTCIIFTTTAGKSLYEAYPDEHLANMTPALILNAISRKQDHSETDPAFPAGICTRLMTGTVIVFSHLDGMHLLRIAERNFGICAERIKETFGCRLLFDPKLTSVFLFGEPGQPDARQISTRSTQFIMQELYEFTRQAYDDSMDIQPETIEFRVTVPHDTPEIASLFEPLQTQVALVVCDPSLYDTIDAVNDSDTSLTIATAATLDEAKTVLTSMDVCMLVIDPMTGYDETLAKGLGIDDLNTESMHIFRQIRNTMQSLPIFIMEHIRPLRRADRDTFMAMGARGILTYKENNFYDRLAELSKAVYLEEKINELSRRECILRCNTAQHLSADRRHAVIEYYDFELQASAAQDSPLYIPERTIRPDVRFSDIIGAKNAKDELSFFLDYLKRPKEYILKGTRPPKGILLYGPPGTGKTMLAMAMAGEAGVTFLPTTATHFMNSYFGESEANIRSLFRTARKYAPSVIFIDEIDAIGKMRTGSSTTAHTENMLNALLTEMDGFMYDPQQPVFVIAATNYQIDADNAEGRPALDPALVRRFDNRILVDLPNEDERKEYLTVTIRKIEGNTVTEEAITNVASRSTGQSLALLRNIIDLAVRNAARAEVPLSDTILISAMDEYSFGEERKWGREYYEGIAYHESGHAYISYLAGEKPSFMTIVSRSDFSGYMQREDREDMPSYTKSQMIWLIRTALAGRASEIVFMGEDAGINTGIASDLISATSLALSMVSQYGMYPHTLLSIDPAAVVDTAAGEKMLKMAEKILEDEMAVTLQLIREGKDKITKLAAVLLEKNQLTGKEIRAILNRN